MGQVKAYFREKAPKDVREAIEDASKDDFLDPGYPYKERMRRKKYEKEMAPLQIELVKLLAWVRSTGARVVIIFEGRDAAGKGGTIKRFCENLNSRAARVVALPKPSDVERGQWYFQRYIRHLPGPGEIVFFDRSWYNRAVVERVFGFSSRTERELFFHQAPEFEDMLVNDGIRLFKFWLTIGRAEQLRRFLDREEDPLKQWKLSPIDYQSLDRWPDYSEAIDEMFARTHNANAPWTVIRADDKKRARIAAIRAVLSAIPYEHRSKDAARPPDPALCAPAGEISLATP
ncbi:polyphosphate kinase 2 [Pikeienuella piscinae]|uniref:ADP/GDP-polyphosphate phosphotransferase n=1 Tax=Pikeienuella piscinae TaxID=2748098 RepID=A0A7L5BTE7_9RHOB|nr:polyphosphate kinase 2 [Pikeienuella piscinae]QIE54003.1 polyphosphate kinase 2 [Pikeienuella piscinae]